MGTRDIACFENNAAEVGVIADSIYQLPKSAQSDFRQTRKMFSQGNLYFSVNILYPLAFHYLFMLESILDEYLLPNVHTDLPSFWTEYTLLQANADRAQIRLLTSLLWNQVADLFGQSDAEELYSLYSEKEYNLPTPSLYVDALLHYQMAHFEKMPAATRKAFHFSSLFEIMDLKGLPEEPDAAFENSSYHKSMQLLAGEGFSFPSKDAFFNALEKAIPEGQPLYENTFDQFLESQYGIIKDEERDFDW